MKRAVSSYGPWALVTGASSGIGRQFAFQLAERGLNILLVARDLGRLEQVASELRENHRVEVRVASIDLAQEGAATDLADASKDLEIGLVVNNAASVLAGSFMKTDLDDEVEVLSVNLASTLRLTRHFGDLMCQRSRGGIILVAGMGGFGSMPLMANYMATKSYLISFGEALHEELQERGVDVLVVAPGVTRTGAEFRSKGLEGERMAGVAGRGLEADKVVASALEALGHSALIVPGTLNRVMAFLIFRLLPRRWARRLLARTVRGAVPRAHR